MLFTVYNASDDISPQQFSSQHRIRQVPIMQVTFIGILLFTCMAVVAMGNDMGYGYYTPYLAPSGGGYRSGFGSGAGGTFSILIYLFVFILVIQVLFGGGWGGSDDHGGGSQYGSGGSQYGSGGSQYGSGGSQYGSGGSHYGRAMTGYTNVGQLGGIQNLGLSTNLAHGHIMDRHK